MGDLLRRRILNSTGSIPVKSGTWITSGNPWGCGYPVWSRLSSNGLHGAAMTAYISANQFEHIMILDFATRPTNVNCGRFKYFDSSANYRIMQYKDYVIASNTYIDMNTTLTTAGSSIVNGTAISTTYNNASYMPFTIDHTKLYTMRTTSYRYYTENLSSWTSQTSYYSPSTGYPLT